MACPKAIQSIKKECDKNKGGIRNVYLAPYSKFSCRLDNKEMVIDLFYSEVYFSRFHQNKNTANFTTTAKIDIETELHYFNSVINLSFPRMSHSKSRKLEQLINNPLIAIVEDNNNNRWLFGYDKPCYLTSYSMQSGTNAKDANKYSIALNCDSAYQPLFIKGNLEIPIFYYIKYQYEGDVCESKLPQHIVEPTSVVRFIEPESYEASVSYDTETCAWMYNVYEKTYFNDGSNETKILTVEKHSIYFGANDSYQERVIKGDYDYGTAKGFYYIIQGAKPYVPPTPPTPPIPPQPEEIKNTILYFTDGSTEERLVTAIDSHFLGERTDVYKVEIGSIVTTFNQGAFANNHGLREVIFGKKVTTLETAAFANCISITNLELNEGLTSLGNQCFASCEGLTSITIPSTVLTLGSECFAGCLALTDITYNGTKTQWKFILKQETTFYDVQCTVHCTDGDISISQLKN